MTRNETIILAGSAKHTAADNVRALEDAGYLVITANNLDYALVASELFCPKVIILDADEIIGDDIEFFYQVITGRNKVQSIYIISKSDISLPDKALTEVHVEHIQSSVSMTDLISRIKSCDKCGDKSRDFTKNHNAIALIFGVSAAVLFVALLISMLIGKPISDSYTIEDTQIPLATPSYSDDQCEEME